MPPRGVGASTPKSLPARAPLAAAASDTPAPSSRASAPTRRAAGPSPLAHPLRHPLRAATALVAKLPFVPKPKGGYPGITLPDLTPARTWRPGGKGMTGAQANALITKTYGTLDAGMSAYLGEPAVANWTTFGKYASREAGGDIIRMEGVMRALEGADPRAALALVEDFGDEPGLLGKQAELLLAASKTPQEFLHKVELMRDALVFGNTQIIRDIAPAFDVFLRAEAAGQDGLAALVAKGYGHPPVDPQGFLLKGFQCYQAAKAAQDQLQASPAPDADEAAALRAERRKWVLEGNLNIGIQEQMLALQDPHAFGDPEVADLVGAFTPSMSLDDANGAHPLLPNGGNWADFPTRMGFKEVPRGQGTYAIAGFDGVTRDYVVNPDAKARQGTIFQYFTDSLAPDKSAKLIAGTPAPLPPYYTSWRARWNHLLETVVHLVDWVLHRPSATAAPVTLGSGLAAGSDAALEARVGAADAAAPGVARAPRP